jgi:hypothetical protein
MTGKGKGKAMAYEVKWNRPGTTLAALEISSPTVAERTFVQEFMRDNWDDSPAYQVRRPSHAFLQCDYQDYILIEFWTGNRANIEACVAYLNANRPV